MEIPHHPSLSLPVIKIKLDEYPTKGYPKLIKMLESVLVATYTPIFSTYFSSQQFFTYYAPYFAQKSTILRSVNRQFSLPVSRDMKKVLQSTAERNVLDRWCLQLSS